MQAWSESPKLSHEMLVSGESLLLQNAGSEVLICPHIGGAIAHYVWNELDILRRAPDDAISDENVRQMGSYALVPYSNRIGNAQLIAGDRTYALQPNFPPEPHSIHGFGWQRAWRIESSTTDSVQLSLGHDPDDAWPFSCHSRQSICLNDNALTLELSVTNLDTHPMPAGLGFHPFFPVTEEAYLQSQWNGVWKAGPDLLPHAWECSSPATDFSHSRSISGWRIDNCFTGWNRTASLKYAEYRVAISASEACSNMVVYSPGDQRNFIALEPVTHINNGFALAAQGHLNTGVRELEPGESLSISMAINPSRSNDTGAVNA